MACSRDPVVATSSSPTHAIFAPAPPKCCTETKSVSFNPAALSPKEWILTAPQEKISKRSQESLCRCSGLRLNPRAILAGSVRLRKPKRLPPAERG